MPVTLVTGGAGYVGRFVVERLLQAGHEVLATGRTQPADGYFSAPVRFARASLEPDEIDRELFAGVDVVVHAAFDHLPGKYRGGEGEDPEGFVRRNLHGSLAIFRAAREAGVRRLVFLSSRAVYGLQPAGADLSEETAPNPETLYGAVKHDAETALPAMAGERFLPIVLRVTGVYGAAGPGREDKWTPLIRDFLAGRTIEPRIGTEVHGDDVAAAVELVLSVPREKLRQPVFNVSDLLVDRRDILAIAKASIGSAHALPEPADGSRVNVMRIDRLRALGWKPGGEDRLRETVAQLMEKLEADPAG